MPSPESWLVQRQQRLDLLIIVGLLKEAKPPIAKRAKNRGVICRLPASICV
jgi:hypothetical protein